MKLINCKFTYFIGVLVKQSQFKHFLSSFNLRMILINDDLINTTNRPVLATVSSGLSLTPLRRKKNDPCTTPFSPSFMFNGVQEFTFLPTVYLFARHTYKCITYMLIFKYPAHHQPTSTLPVFHSN
jgi:hypothetical protein